MPAEHSQQRTSDEPPGDPPAEPHASVQPPPPGRPWVKGQSGNPRGRPSYSHKAAFVAQRMFDRKTLQLVDKVIGWGQGSDKSMLRLYTQKMVPPRQEVPVWLNLPPIGGSRRSPRRAESRRDRRRARRHPLGAGPQAGAPLQRDLPPPVNARAPSRPQPRPVAVAAVPVAAEVACCNAGVALSSAVASGARMAAGEAKAGGEP